MMESRLPPAPCRSRVVSCPSSIAPTCFWLVVVYIRCRLRPQCIFILDFSIAQFNGPNYGMTPHPTLIAQHAVTPTYRPLLSPTFGWLLCLSIKWRPSKAKGLIFSLFLIFLSLNSTAQTMGQHPTPPLSPSAPSPPPMIHRCHQLWVGCCIPPSSGGHLRPRVGPSLYFLMWLNSMSPRQAPMTVSANLPPGTCN
jgi:hypothetical protein